MSLTDYSGRTNGQMDRWSNTAIKVQICVKCISKQNLIEINHVVQGLCAFSLTMTGRTDAR